MKTVRSTGKVWRMVVGVCMALALTAGVAQGAAEPHPHVGKLPGYPVIRGVVPVLGSKAAVSAHEKLVKGAFSTRARHASGLTGATEPNERFISECEEEAFFASTHDVCYRGGPVLRDPTIHLVFWQGEVEEDISKEPHVKLFPLGYIETVKRYFEDLVHDNGAQTNVFAIDPQYFDENAKGELVSGEYALSFDKEVDITVDTTKFPEHLTGGCTDETAYSEGPCLLDSDIQNEAEKVAGTSTKGLKDIYVVFTPPGVGGCFEAKSGECAYRQYCAYHGDFGGNGRTPGNQTLYADLPYLGEVPGCDSFVHPNEVVSSLEEKNHEDHGADAVIDTASHELNETITDPIGSQCETGAKGASECEPNSWTDVIGQEVADKCLPPESTVFGTHGEPIGELLPGREASLYNQNIASDHYWTQREWSNEAGLFEGSCVQRAINASFTISAGAQATVPMTLDGSASGAPGDPATYWVWNFGGGEQVGTASPTISHTFAEAGEQIVALTAYDRYGNAEATVESFKVGPAPTPSPPRVPTSPSAPNVITVKELVTPPHLTAGQVGTKLGLHVTKLSGKGPFTLGRAECPPACAVTLQLYAKVPTAPGSRHSIKLVLIGNAHIALATKGAKKLVLSLNAKGRALSRANRSLRCRLAVTVEGQEGGVWQIVRLPTLTR